MTNSTLQAPKPHVKLRRRNTKLSKETLEAGMDILERYCENYYPENRLSTNSDLHLEFGDYQLLSRKEKLKYIYEKFGLKYVLYLLVFVTYACLGGLMFQYLERPNQDGRLKQLEFYHRTERAYLIGNITRFFNRLDKNHDSYDYLEEEHSQIFQHIEGFINLYDRNMNITLREHEPKYSWTDFLSAVFYATTLMTSIGYGNMVCRTGYGKMATVIYSFIGIPITLVVLDRWGRLMLAAAQGVWLTLLRYSRNLVKSLRRRRKMLTRRFSSRRPLSDSPGRGRRRSSILPAQEAINSIQPIQDTLPLSLVLILIVIYTLLCSYLFTFWEKSRGNWKYADSMYYLFISLSTIGLGDHMPSEPAIALAGMVLLVIGLSFVSMCLQVLFARLEARYMAAIQMVEARATEMRSTSNSTSRINNLMSTIPVLTIMDQSHRAFSDNELYIDSDTDNDLDEDNDDEHTDLNANHVKAAETAEIKEITKDTNKSGILVSHKDSAQSNTASKKQVKISLEESDEHL